MYVYVFIVLKIFFSAFSNYLPFSMLVNLGTFTEELRILAVKAVEQAASAQMAPEP